MFANGRVPDAMIVGGLTGLHCGANVVPVLLLAHLLVLLGHRSAARSSPGGSTRGVSPAEAVKRGNRSGLGGRKAANPAVAASPRFRFGWLAAVLLLTLFWLD